MNDLKQRRQKKPRKLQKLQTFLLACLLLFGLAACDKQDKTWAMKRGDEVIPIGSYIYNFYSATVGAQYQEGLDSSKSMLEQQIEGKPAEEWIREKAVQNTKMLFVVDDLMKEYGLSLSSDDNKEIETISNSGWSLVAESLGKYVAKSSYKKAYAELSYKYTMVFKAIYGKGGKQAVPQADIEKYVTDNYTDYVYVSASLYDSELNKLDEEKQKRLKSDLEEYAEKINSGSMTLEEAAEKYEKDYEASNSLVDGVADLKTQGNNEKLINAINGLEIEKAAVVDLSEDASAYILVYKRDMKKTVGSYLEDEGNLLAILDILKGDEFADMVEEKVNALTEIEINEEALGDYTASMYYTFRAPVSSEGSSSSSSSSSSEEGTSSNSEENSSSALASGSSSVAESSKEYENESASEGQG